MFEYLVNNYRSGVLGFAKGAHPNLRGYAYTGEEYDRYSGLLYLRARFYDASIGRFISADPYWGRLEEPVTQNRYAYVHNNPLLYTDPSGLQRTYNSSYRPSYNTGRGTGLYNGTFGNPHNLVVLRNDRGGNSYQNNNWYSNSNVIPPSPIMPRKNQSPEIFNTYWRNIPENSMYADKTGPNDPVYMFYMGIIDDQIDDLIAENLGTDPFLGDARYGCNICPCPR